MPVPQEFVSCRVFRRLVQPAGLRRQLEAVERRLEEALAESEGLQRQLALRNAALDAGTSFFMIVDACTPRHTMVYVNRALAHAHGYEPAKMMGCSVAQLMKPLGNPNRRTEMDAAFANGQPYRVDAKPAFTTSM